VSQVTPITPAKIGRTIHVIGKAVESNGATVAPAVITRVWGEPQPGGKQMINLTAFPDGAAPLPMGSVFLYPSREAAHDAVHGVTGTDSAAAFWPERA